MLTKRTPEAHVSALKTFRQVQVRRHVPAAERRWARSSSRAYDGGAEWGGPAFDPETGLLYVNANEMAWLLQDDPARRPLALQQHCASCHGDDMKGNATRPIARRHRAASVARGDRRRSFARARDACPAFSEMLESGAINDLVNFLMTGHDVAETAATNPNFLKYRNNGYQIFLDHEGYPASRRRGARSTRSI